MPSSVKAASAPQVASVQDETATAPPPAIAGARLVQPQAPNLGSTGLVGTPVRNGSILAAMLAARETTVAGVHIVNAPDEPTAVYLGNGPIDSIPGLNSYIPSQQRGVPAGNPAEITYSRSSLPGLGNDIKRVSLFTKINGVITQTDQVFEPPQTPYGTKFAFPVAADALGQVEFWFEQEAADGRTAWDSQGGKNFKLDIIPAPTAVVSFDADWGEAVAGTVKAGSAFKLDFDASRIVQFMGPQASHGGPSTSVAAYVAFDGGAPQRYMITNWVGSDMQVRQPTIAIPAGAKSMQLWFQGMGIGGSNRYDSNFGMNYSFSVEA